MSVSGTVEAFKALLNGKGQEELEAEVAKELKNLKK
jgi:hypothetical protein